MDKEDILFNIRIINNKNIIFLYITFYLFFILENKKIIVFIKKKKMNLSIN